MEIRLPNEIDTAYDLNHMVPYPFTHLPAGAFRKINMQRGDVLFRQNQSASGLYHVDTGCVTLQRIGVGGDVLTLHRAVADGFFAEASIFSKTYHCDAVCAVAGQVTKINGAAVVLALRSKPQFSEGFTRLLAVQVQHDRAHIEMLALASAKERVSAAVHAGYLDATVIEMATRINLTPEACYRALRALCEEGRMTKTRQGRYHPK